MAWCCGPAGVLRAAGCRETLRLGQLQPSTSAIAIAPKQRITPTRTSASKGCTWAQSHMLSTCSLNVSPPWAPCPRSVALKSPVSLKCVGVWAPPERFQFEGRGLGSAGISVFKGIASSLRSVCGFSVRVQCAGSVCGFSVRVQCAGSVCGLSVGFRAPGKAHGPAVPTSLCR